MQTGLRPLCLSLMGHAVVVDAGQENYQDYKVISSIEIAKG